MPRHKPPGAGLPEGVGHLSRRPLPRPPSHRPRRGEGRRRGRRGLLRRMPAEGKRGRAQPRGRQRDSRREAAPARLAAFLAPPLGDAGRKKGDGEGGARLREAAALPPAPPRREREEESKQARRTASRFNGLGLRARRVPAWRCSGPREHAGASLARPAAAVAPRPFPSRSEMAGDGEGWGWSCRGS